MGRRTVDLNESLFAAGEEDDDGGGEATDDDGGDDAFAAMVATTRAKMHRRKTKPKTIAAAVFNRALTEADEMLRSGNWEGAGVRHLVAAYDRCHTRCYGVEPAELGPSERFNASMLAATMLKREFNGDLVGMVEYMLWAWERELDREKWRRENGRDGGRIGVRLMFSGALLTDYRLHLARRGRSA